MQNNNSTALLILDMQENLLQRLEGSEKLIDTVSKAIQYARENEIPVVYAVVGFRKGLPEISIHNKTFGNLASMLEKTSMESFMTIVPQLAPVENEPVVIKKRFSAFVGSDLEVILRSQQAKHLVMCGVVTSGVILSTALEAADKDYQLTILSDGCQDQQPDVHQMLMEKILPRHAIIQTCEEWIKG
jgi:nicotinamidase-related amidase